MKIDKELGEQEKVDKQKIGLKKVTGTITIDDTAWLSWRKRKIQTKET